MANTILTPTTITREALRVLNNEVVLAKKVDRQYDSSFAQSGGKIGDTLKVRRPVEYTVRSGATYSAQDVTETSVDLTVATQRGIDFEFTSDELTMDIDSFSERYIKPGMVRLANEIDYLLYNAAYQAVANQVGTAGTTPATALVYLQAGEKLDYFATPRDDQRCMVLNPAAHAASVDGLKGLFAPSSKIGEQYEKGLLGMDVLGFDFYMSQNVRTHTVGPLGGTPLVNGASQSITTGWAATASLITDGWTAAAANRLKAGDIFTIANVYAVNPITKQSTAQLQQFVVTADVSSDGLGNLTAVIAPAIISAGAYQNVNSVPADNAALTVVGTASTGYPINLAFHKSAIALVTADLQMPRGVDMASRANQDGMSLRFTRQWDVTDDKFKSRFDVLFGYKVLRPEWACRVIG